MKLIGKSKLTSKVVDTTKNFYDYRDSYFTKFRYFDLENAERIFSFATSKEVKATVDNVNLAVSKNDIACTYPDRDDTIHRLSVLFTKRMLAPVLTQSSSSFGDPITFVSTSSGGPTAKTIGRPKTADFIETEAFNKLLVDFNHIPVEIMNTKSELLDTETDLSRNKIRLVSNVEKFLLAKQKLLFDAQNTALASNWQSSWIKYGMVKQYGGFDLFVSSFEPFSMISLSDVSGYDKSAVLTDVYDIRLSFLKKGDLQSPSEFDALVGHVLFNILNPTRILPNGDVVRLDFSNSSGQNNTTTDNCILHTIIIFNLLISIYYSKYQDYPTYDQIVENASAAIYSDDKVLGLNHFLVPESVSEFIALEKDVYAKYGMTIKASASRVFSHIPNQIFSHSEAIEFLGSTSLWDAEKDFYRPVPRLGKLMSSLTQKIVAYNDEDLDPSEQFSKLVQIFSLMSAGRVENELLIAVHAFIEFMFRLYPDYTFQFNEFILAYTNGADLLSPSAFDYQITGNQSGLKNSKHFYTLSGILPPVNFFCVWSGGWMVLKALMERVTKFEKKLEQLKIRTGMTEAGKQWLTAAIDPFHDVALNVQGYPDMVGGSSIVQCVKQTVSITINPVSFPGGADVSVRFEPLLNSVPTFGNIFNSNGIITSTNATQSSFGGLNIRYGPPGVDLSQPGPVQFTQLQPPGTFAKRRLRVIAAGFEVHNATPELYKGGSVTVYRQEQSMDKMVVAGGIPTNSNMELMMVQPGPSSEGNALLLSGSKTWDAAAGCYCVCSLQSLENPASYPKLLGVMETTQYVSRTLSFDNGGAGLPTAGTYFVSTADVGGDRFNNTLMVPLPFNSSGAYFTGLPANSVLKINCNWWIERFPSEIDGDLTVLATPSCEFDPIALEAYARIVRMQPIGVPVCENGLGDWFASCVASVIDGMIGIPIASNLLRAGNYMFDSRAQNNSSPYTNTQSAKQIVQVKPRNPKKAPKGSPARQLQKAAKSNRGENSPKFIGPKRAPK